MRQTAPLIQPIQQLTIKIYAGFARITSHKTIRKGKPVIKRPGALRAKRSKAELSRRKRTAKVRRWLRNTAVPTMAEVMGGGGRVQVYEYQPDIDTVKVREHWNKQGAVMVYPVRYRTRVRVAVGFRSMGWCGDTLGGELKGSGHYQQGKKNRDRNIYNLYRMRDTLCPPDQVKAATVQTERNKYTVRNGTRPLRTKERVLRLYMQGAAAAAAEMYALYKERIIAKRTRGFGGDEYGGHSQETVVAVISASEAYRLFRSHYKPPDDG